MTNPTGNDAFIDIYILKSLCVQKKQDALKAWKLRSTQLRALEDRYEFR